MQNYIDIAQKKGVMLQDLGPCQFCGARTARGVHECVELFSLGFQLIDFGNPSNHRYRFLSVDAHTLQHPEIHGRWNNHFHLLRLHLVLVENVKWNYQLSPALSDFLNKYKVTNPNEQLSPPSIGRRGKINTVEISENAHNEKSCQEWIENWALDVYQSWKEHHQRISVLAKDFLDQ